MAVAQSFVICKVIALDLNVAVENVNGTSLFSYIICKQIACDR
jgi:hypothetical protein